MDLPHLDQLENRKKRNNDLHLALLLFQKLAETESLMCLHIFMYVVKTVRQCHFFLLDLPESAAHRVNLVRLPAHHIFKNAVQLRQGEISEKQVQIHRFHILLALPPGSQAFCTGRSPHPSAVP